jgi:hypothetical protein
MGNREWKQGEVLSGSRGKYKKRLWSGCGGCLIWWCFYSLKGGLEVDVEGV